MSIIMHLEAHLGAIRKGWKVRGPSSSIQVVEFKDQPFEGVKTYSSLGLSDVTFQMSRTQKVRQEIIFSAYERFKADQIASFLSTFAEHLISRNRVLLRGDVIGPSTPIVLGTLLNSVYSAIPVVFQDSFAVCNETTPPTVMVWLVPLYEEEANFARSVGWQAFEELVAKQNPDLWDLVRDPIV